MTFFCTNDIPNCIRGRLVPAHHEVPVASGDDFADLPAFGYVVGVGDDEGARARVVQATRPLDDVRVVVLPGSLGSCGCVVAIEAVAPFECAVLSGRVHHLLAVANGGVSHRLHARLAHQGQTTAEEFGASVFATHQLVDLVFEPVLEVCLQLADGTVLVRDTHTDLRDTTSICTFTPSRGLLGSCSL